MFGERFRPFPWWTILAMGAACSPVHAPSPPHGAGAPIGLAKRVTAPCAARSVDGTANAVLFSAACGPELARTVRSAVDDPVVDYWDPDPPLIRSVDERLRAALEFGRTKPELIYVMPKDAEARDDAERGVRSAIDEILASYGNYGRQYLGIVLRSGDKRVLVNCFLEDDAQDWKRRWFRHDEIDDGGPSLWRIQYDVRSGRFWGFDVNPSA